MTRGWPGVGAALALLLTAGSGCPSTAEDRLQIADLVVDHHPDNTLACVVRWTTSRPATTRVEFGEGSAVDGELDEDWEATHVLEDGALVTDHEIVVFGLREQITVGVRAISVDESGEEARARPEVYESGVVPDLAARFEGVLLDEERWQPGWTLTHCLGDLTGRSVALALDPQGQPVWYRAMGTGASFIDVDVTLVDGDRVLIGGDLQPFERPIEVGWDGEVVWRGPPQPEEPLSPGTAHHVFRKLENGHYLTLLFDEHGGVVTDEIAELDADGEVVWRWDTADHIPGAEAEHVHANMVELDAGANELLLNSRHRSALYRIDRDSGEIAWTFGVDGDFTMEPGHPDPWFQHAHATELQPDGSILLYDNGDGLERPWSRVIQYELDHEGHTARVAWEYPGELSDHEWFTSFWGDADRLSNGNTLVTAGSIFEWDSPSSLFEVTPEGDTVWQVDVLGLAAGERAGCYAAERIDAPVGVL